MNAKTDLTGATDTLKVETLEGGIVVVTLNRPDVANAINTQMGSELEAIFNGFNTSPKPPPVEPTEPPSVMRG